MLDKALKKYAESDEMYKFSLETDMEFFNVGKILIENENLKQVISSQLKDLKLYNYSFLAHGGYAIVLDTGQDQVIRITSSYANEHIQREYLEDLPEALQPIYSKEIEAEDGTKIYLDILPKVKLLSEENGFSKEEIKNYENALAISLAKRGYDFDFGANSTNIGVIKDDASPTGWLPVIIDIGAVLKLQKDIPIKIKSDYKFSWEGKQSGLSSRGVIPSPSTNLEENISGILASLVNRVKAS